MKLDEYRIERYPNGEWGALYGPDQRVRIYDDLWTLMRAMGEGLPKDHPRLAMIRVEVHDGRFEDWPPNEGMMDLLCYWLDRLSQRIRIRAEVIRLKTLALRATRRPNR